MQHFSSTRSKKMLQHFFSENVTRGAYLQHAGILDVCSKQNVATFLQQNQISLILLQFICNIFNVLQHNFSLRSIFSRGPYVQHIFAENTTVILS